jgi:flagellar motor switch protein FliN
MNADALSQDEIDALLKGTAGADGDDSVVDPEEKKALMDLGNKEATAFVTVLESMMDTSFHIELGRVVSCNAESVLEHLPQELVVGMVEFKKGLSGKICTLFKKKEAAEVCLKLTGGESYGDDEESAFSEVINQIMGGANQALTAMLENEISSGVPEVKSLGKDDPDFGEWLPSTERFCLINYIYSGGEDIEGEFFQAVPNSIIDALMSATAPPPPPPQPTPQPSDPVAGQPQIQPAGFQELGPSSAEETTNLDLILDIGLSVRVELGRTSMKIRDILNLGPGSVVELNKLAGEPVELIVNDKLFAKGEVVVIDENFGVRVTDILSIEERIETLR